jgi:hypothetical protein
MKWKVRVKKSEEANQPGHKVYAEKQVAMWQMFVGEAERGFEGMMIEE